MRWLWLAAGGVFSCLLSLGGPSPVRAEARPNPLRLVPAQADLLVQVPNPRRLVETFTTLKLLKDLQEFEAVRELYDSTNSRRFYQLIAYFEKELGYKWPELLERLSGQGAVLAVKYGGEPAPALFVFQGTDDVLLRKFVNLGLEIIEQELARQESKDRVEKRLYREIETIHIGSKFHAARAGSALLIGNTEKALQSGFDLYQARTQDSAANLPSVAEARKLLPPDPLGWMWLNMETVRKGPQAEELFKLPRNDANLTMLFGGWLDVARRSPFLCAGLYRQPDGILTTLRMPRGREGMPEVLALHLPPPHQPGSLPLLEPPGVLYSSSYFLDLAKFWEYRHQLLTLQQMKFVDEYDKSSGPILFGQRFSDILVNVGSHQRIVIANKPANRGMVNRAGNKAAVTNIPAFALVVDLRRPEEFSKAMNPILRGAALLAGSQVKLKMVEEKQGDHMIVGYRFPEDAPLKGDVNNIRFNFTPCFVRVGNQFVFSSTLELAHELVDILDREATAAPSKAMTPSAQSQIYSAGGADALREIEDQLIAQTFFSQALPPEESRQQVRAFLDWVRRLGILRLEAGYGDRDFHYDIRLLLNKPSGTRN